MHPDPSALQSTDPDFQFLNVRQSYVETAQPIVKLSSLPGSPMILVIWGPNLSRNSNGNTPNGGVKCKGCRKKLQFQTNISL